MMAPCLGGGGVRQLSRRVAIDKDGGTSVGEGLNHTRIHIKYSLSYIPLVL